MDFVVKERGNLNRICTAFDWDFDVNFLSTASR
jgi:hypothetical protein